MSGDYKSAFGKAKSGRVLFVDAGSLNGRRTLGLFTATGMSEVEAYAGHVFLADDNGAASPTAIPVSFSVRSGADDNAMAAGLTACAHAGQRMIMASWDGKINASFKDATMLASFLRDYSGSAVFDEAEHSDPRVIRTTLQAELFKPKAGSKKNVSNLMVTPSPAAVGLIIGDPEPAQAARDAVRRAAGAAAKMGYGPLLGPDIDADAASAALSAVLNPDTAAMDYYGGAGLPQGDVRRTDRLQAARTVPILAGMIATDDDLRRAVDGRLPLQPLLMETTGLTKGALKRLSKITEAFEEAGMQDAGYVTMTEDQLGSNRVGRFVVRGALSLEQALAHLSQLPPEWAPESNESWRAFADVLGGLAVPLSAATNKPVKDLLSASKGDWVAYKATLAKAADIPAEEFNRARMAGVAGEAMEMLGSFATTAILPMVAQVLRRTGHAAAIGAGADIVEGAIQTATQIAPEIVIGRSKNTLAALLEAERRYISRDTAIWGIAEHPDEGEVVEPERRAELNLLRLAENLAFPVLRETWVASNGFVVEPFRCEQDMIAEGQLMGHCVGGFHRHNGSSGAFHYFSVRHPDTMQDPRQRATLRLLPISPGSSLQIGEFRSHRNSEPSAACKAAYREWAASFLRADLDAAGQRMDEWRRFREQAGLNTSARGRTPDEIWYSRIRVRTSVPGVASQLWKEWSENVLSGWPSDNPEVLFRSAAVRELLSSISPASAQALRDEAEAKRAEGPEGPAP